MRKLMFNLVHMQLNKEWSPSKVILRNLSQSQQTHLLRHANQISLGFMQGDGERRLGI